MRDMTVRFGRRPLVVVAIITTFASIYLWTILPSSFGLRAKIFGDGPVTAVQVVFPPEPVGDEEFGEMGRRVQLLRGYLEYLEDPALKDKGKERATVTTRIEEQVLTIFPFLKRPLVKDSKPLQSLRKGFIPGSRGIVIPVGVKHFRFAAHLVNNIRNVFNSTLPIVVAFAGDDDLPVPYREALLSLGPDIDVLDVTSLFDNELLQLQGSWAVKPFALLGCKFEEVILLDADAVMLQDPAVVFDYPGYIETGTYLFHDRLLWKGGFKERHDWWRNQTANHIPSAALNRSLVWTEEYAEEQDSGMIVLDKRKLVVLTALLHICWQNSRSVRDKVTYRITYGDKESYWFGLELAGAEYMFEESYGSIAGYIQDDKVCSFTIAHPDAIDPSKLLWYNGSQLKNKEVNLTEFTVPEYWMRDAEWLKGGSKPEMSCMKGGKIQEIDPEQVTLAQMSVVAAKKVDRMFSPLIELPS